VVAVAGLDGGLLLGANGEVALTERFAPKAPLIELEHPAFFAKSGSRGKGSCHAAREGSHRPKATGKMVVSEIEATMPCSMAVRARSGAGQRHAALGGQLTRQRLDRDNNLRGKAGAARSVDIERRNACRNVWETVVL
jgi:hypothetical protein